MSTRVDMKPPYSLPTMAEIARVRGSTGLSVVSTFSGCGGSCLGLEMAGFDIRYASEFVEAARDTYRLNHAADVYLDHRDIRSVRPEEILERLGLERGELDVFEGSPPCASFSMGGNREKDWGKVKTYSDVKQRTDDLFFEWARILEGLGPKAFIAENVSGLVKGAAFGYFKMIIEKLKLLGYVVGTRVLDAQWLGVPQRRQRLIFIGVRNDLARELGFFSGRDLPFPKPLGYYYSMRDAAPHMGGAGNALPSIEPTLEELREATSKVEGYAIAKEWDRIRPGQQSARYFNLIKPHLDRPLSTVTAVGGGAGVASVVHPTERRKFTMRELRRFCSFPDDFRLTGTYAQQWERLGRSVPPRMMYYIGAALRDGVFAPLGLLRDGWAEAP